MSFEVPDDLYYVESHEWVRDQNGTVRVGITDFAQDELGDVVFVELPAVGDTVERDEAFGVIESIKAVSDIYAPIAGEVTAVNEGVIDEPELINDDTYGEGWLVELEPTEPLDSLLSSGEYAESLD